MTYELGFLASALKEWRTLDAQTRDQFKKKLAERLEDPHVPASKLSDLDWHHAVDASDELAFPGCLYARLSIGVSPTTLSWFHTLGGLTSWLRSELSTPVQPRCRQSPSS